MVTVLEEELVALRLPDRLGVRVLVGVVDPVLMVSVTEKAVGVGVVERDSVAEPVEERTSVLE